MKDIKDYITEGLFDIDDNINIEMPIESMRIWLKDHTYFRAGREIPDSNIVPEGNGIKIIQERGMATMVFKEVPPFPVYIKGRSAGISEITNTDFLTIESDVDYGFLIFFGKIKGGSYAPGENLTKQDIIYSFWECSNMKIDLSNASKKSSMETYNSNNMEYKMPPKLELVYFWDSHKCKYSGLKQTKLLRFSNYNHFDKDTIDGDKNIKITRVHCSSCDIFGIPDCAKGANNFESYGCNYEKCSTIELTEPKRLVFSSNDKFKTEDISSFNKTLKMTYARNNFNIPYHFPEATIKSR